MLKLKRKNGPIAPEPDYDSMIENGSSESEDGSQDDTSESDDGFSEKEEEETPKKPTPSKKKGPAAVEPPPKKFKQPTVEEINELRDTENNFHSNMFRLQIGEILKETRVSQKTQNYIDSWMEKFKKFAGKLKDGETAEPSDKLQFLKDSDVKVPLNLEMTVKPFSFQFFAPEEKPLIVGSAKTQTVLGNILQVDVLLEMPAKSFCKDDYLNLVYERKRAFYLAYLAIQLGKPGTEDLSSTAHFSYFRNNTLRPVLELTPPGDMAKKVSFRILVVPDSTSFKLNRFVPWTSNIRGSLFGEKMMDDMMPSPTPNYNANVLFDLTTKSSQTLVDEVILPNTNFKEGLILLKIWLKQRKLDEGHSGFSSHLMTLYVVHLYKEKRINLTMSSYQVARNVWSNLVLSEWAAKGVSMCKVTGLPNQPTLQQFHDSYELVFVDPSGYLNLASNLSLENYQRIRFEAKRAVDLLNEKGVNSFQALFLKKCPVYSQYDHILRFSKSFVVNRVIKAYSKRYDIHNHAKLWLPRFIKIIVPILRRGLGERVNYLTLIESPMEKWSLTTAPQKAEKILQIGLGLNPDNAFEILDKGPQANDEASKDFREFWGSKADLRRFQDGSITEACVWCSSADTLATKRLICKNIVEHLLLHHFKVAATEFDYFAAELDDLFKLNTLFVKELTDLSEDSENCTLSVIQVADELGKQMRQLNDVPLDISGIQGTSAVFRYCEPDTILPRAKEVDTLFYGHKVHDLVIQLGMSGKWPSEVTALRSMKAAFYIQIAGMLRDQCNLKTKVTTEGFLVLKKKFVYKVEIYHPKEIILMKQAVNEKGITVYKDTPDSLELEKKLAVMPKITSALHGVYQKYTAFGPSVMIAKRWIYSQLLDTALWSDECTELLMASLFLKMGPSEFVHQPQTGFLRFLQLLATTNWQTEMVLLNFNNEISDEDVSKLEQKFATNRSSFPPLFVATSFDNQKTKFWTNEERPSELILRRVSLLAKEALAIVEPTFNDPRLGFQKDFLFTPSTAGYNVIIHLSPTVIQPCLSTELFSGKEEYAPGSFIKKPVVPEIPLAGYNPVRRVLEDLRSAYGDLALFFFNPCGGKYIAVLWKPTVFEERDFAVTGSSACSVVGVNRVQVKIDKIIDDFKLILSGMYTSIVRQ